MICISYLLMLHKTLKMHVFVANSCFIFMIGYDGSIGEMAERSKAAVLKTVEGSSPPRVRIPVSPFVMSTQQGAVNEHNKSDAG